MSAPKPVRIGRKTSTSSWPEPVNSSSRSAIRQESPTLRRCFKSSKGGRRRAQRHRQPCENPYPYSSSMYGSASAGVNREAATHVCGGGLDAVNKWCDKSIFALLLHSTCLPDPTRSCGSNSGSGAK
jgi:hypothetical protein